MAEQPELPGLPDAPETPEWVKIMRWLHAHREALMRPQVILVVLIALAAGYWFGSSRSAEQLAVRDDRISFLNDQISAYRGRLQGATPDQAAKEIRELRENLADANRKLQRFFPDNPRHLTADQKKFLHDTGEGLSMLITKQLPVFSWSIGDSPRYALELVEEFRKNQINVGDPSLTACQDTERGVLVGLADANHPSADALGFIRYLEDMGLKPSKTTWAKPYAGYEFDLFICGG
jgi:hypothetical protein